jgi:hypothetical protein
VYLYNATSTGDGVSETTYSLTAFTTNTETVTWSAVANDAPVNDTAPVLLNPDNTDYLYARYRFYIITSNVSDAQGYADISYVELSLYTDDQLTEKWRIRYTVSGSSFSVELGSGIIVVAAYSYADESGTEIGIVWYIKIDWDHTDMTLIDTKQYVYDGSLSDTDWYESDWNTECRITYTVSPYLSDDRGDINTADLQADGTIQYYGFALYPRANETDVWLLHDVSGTWTDDVDGSGAFTITSIGSSATVRLNTYTFKVVTQGAGSGGTDLYFTTSKTDTFITDRIEFYTSGVDDGRIDTSTTGKAYWLVRYDYDNVAITSGLTSALNVSKSLAYNGTHWIFSESKGTAQDVGYVVESASETGYGLTAWTSSAGATTIIWDSLTVTVTDPSDQRIDVNANATGIYVSAVYDYDSSAFDGVLTLNDTTYDYSTVGIRGYTVASASGDTYGITTINTNDDTWCIWDQVVVTDLEYNSTYVDYGETIRINVTLIYDYDDAQITAGSFAINTESLTHIELGRWQVNVTQAGAYQQVLDELTTCSATLYGITVHSMGGLNESVYWDEIEFYSSSVEDDRIDVNTFGYTYWLARLLSASDVTISSSLVAQVDGGISLSYIAGAWRGAENSTSVTNITYGVISATFDEISQYSQTASNVSIVWDRIRVLTTVAEPTEQVATFLILVHVTLELEYDNFPITAGFIYLDAKILIWDSDETRWETLFTESVGGTLTYFVNSTSTEATYGITALDTNSKYAVVVWAPAPEGTGGHDYDRPPSILIVYAPAWTLVSIGIVVISMIYFYGIPFFDVDGLNGLSDTERRNLYRNVREQLVRAGPKIRDTFKSMGKALGNTQTSIRRIVRKIRNRLGV